MSRLDSKFNWWTAFAFVAVLIGLVNSLSVQSLPVAVVAFAGFVSGFAAQLYYAWKGSNR